MSEMKDTGERASGRKTRSGFGRARSIEIDTPNLDQSMVPTKIGRGDLECVLMYIWHIP